MSVSERILDWAYQCKSLSSDMTKLGDALYQFQKQTVPIPDLDRLRAVAGDKKQPLQTVEAWERLRQVWDSCPERDTGARFQAIYRALDNGDYPSFIRGLVDKSAAVAADNGRAKKLYDEAKLFESKSTHLVKCAQILSIELTDYVNGKMVFALTAEAKPDFDKCQVLQYTPLTALDYNAKITAFPRQSMYQIAQRWLAAAQAEGYDHFELMGNRDRGGIAEIMSGFDRNTLSTIKSQIESRTTLWLIIKNTSIPDFIEHVPQRNTERVDFARSSSRGRSIRLDVNLLLKNHLTGCDSWYIHGIAPLLDRVAESYRK